MIASIHGCFVVTNRERSVKLSLARLGTFYSLAFQHHHGPSQVSLSKRCTCCDLTFRHDSILRTAFKSCMRNVVVYTNMAASASKSNQLVAEMTTLWHRIRAVRPHYHRLDDLEKEPASSPKLRTGRRSNAWTATLVVVLVTALAGIYGLTRYRTPCTVCL